MKSEKKGKKLDFFESLEHEAGLKSARPIKKAKSALHKWGDHFDDEKFEPLPRILLENLDVFQFKGSELAVLIQILMWWMDRTKWPTCHYESISSRTGLSTRMIMDTLKRLEEKQIKVPSISFEMVKGRPSIIYKETKWSTLGVIKRLKYSELPPGMKTRSNNGARFFDLSNLIDICEHLLNQKNMAKRGEESINMVRQTKSSDELIEEITASKDFQSYSRFLRKHQ